MKYKEADPFIKNTSQVPSLPNKKIQCLFYMTDIDWLKLRIKIRQRIFVRPYFFDVILEHRS